MSLHQFRKTQPLLANLFLPVCANQSIFLIELLLVFMIKALDDCNFFLVETGYPAPDLGKGTTLLKVGDEIHDSDAAG